MPKRVKKAKAGPPRPSARPKILCKRLGPDEIDFVQIAQDFDTGLSKHIRNHSRWLAKVLNELRGGRRLAFGAFTNNSGGILTHVGSALFKPSSAGVGEIKNILISPTLEPDHRTFVYKELISFIERFAQKRGYSQLDIELFIQSSAVANYSAGYNPISTLIEEDYTLQSVRASTYLRSDTFYVFSKLFSPGFRGDATDYPEVAQWLLETYFGFTSISPFHHIFSAKEAFYLCTFLVPYPNASYSITGIAVIDTSQSNDNVGTAHSLLTSFSTTPLRDQIASQPALVNALSGGGNIRLLVQLYQPIQQGSLSDGIWFLSANKVRKLLGGGNRQNIRIESIAGILLEVTPEQLAKALETGQVFTYFLVNSGYDLYSACAGSDGSDFYALLADNNAGGTSKMSSTIWGVSKIKWVLRRTAQSAYYSSGPSLRIWRTEDIDFFSADPGNTEDGNHLVHVLRLGAPVKLNRRIPLNQIMSTADLDLSTRYVSKSELGKLGELDDACLRLADEAAASAEFGESNGEPQWHAALLTTFSTALAVLSKLPKCAFLPEPDGEIRKQLINRTEHTAERFGENESLFFPSFDSQAKSKAVEAEALMTVFFTNPNEVSGWHLRFNLAPFVSNVPDGTLRAKLALHFPSKDSFENTVRFEVRGILTQLFGSDEDANTRRVSRERILRDVFAINADLYAQEIRQRNAEDFTFQLLKTLTPSELHTSILVPMQKAMSSSKRTRESSILQSHRERIDDLCAAMTAILSLG